MRITNRMMVETVAANLRRSMAALSDAQNKLSNGKQLTKPSDDPAAVSRALAFRRNINENEQYLRGMDAASSWLSATDKAIGMVEDLVIKARSLTIRATSGSQGAEQLAVMADQMDEMLAELIQLGNMTFGDDYVFGGTRQTEPPYALTTAPVAHVAFKGNDNLMERSIGQSTAVVVNARASDVFGAHVVDATDPADPGLDPSQNTFAAFISIRDALRAGDLERAGEGIAHLDAALTRASGARADVGVRGSYVEALAAQMRSAQLNLRSRLSKDEDLDVAKALSDYAVKEMMYNAGLATAGKTLLPSLIDYLR